ncbi:MAG: DUF1559 domain-containing protein [Thermoguttaceae bacterium]
MKPSIQLAFFFALFAAPTLVCAGERSAAAARAKAVAPYVDDLTVTVAHVDLSRVDMGPLVEMLARLIPDAKDEIGRVQGEAAKRIGSFLEAGGRDVYITVSLGGAGPFPRVLAVFPIPAGTDETAIRAALAVPAEAGRRIGDSLVIRLPPMENQPFEIRASQRPELTAAFEAAGDGAAQGVLIPPAYTRRVIEELMPQLPKEIGSGPSSILTRGVWWAAVGIDLPPRLALHAVIKSQDASAAVAFRGKWAEVLRLAGQYEGVRRVVPKLAEVTPLLTPKVEGDRLILTFDQKTATIDTLVAAIEMPLQKMHSAAQQSHSLNNLKQIVLAMHNYHDVYKHFPAAAGCGPDGKPLLSWRVYILPFVEQKHLFDQFHLNEPWDSPHNKPLIGQMPAAFRSPRSKAEKGKTNYLVPVGNGALYTSSRDEPQLKQITDGTSNTIMAVEVDDRHAVVWTRPNDFAFDPKDPKKGIGSLYEGEFNTAFCDASVRFISRNIDPKTLAALFTRAGGEAVEPF